MPRRMPARNTKSRFECSQSTDENDNVEREQADPSPPAFHHFSQARM